MIRSVLCALLFLLPFVTCAPLLLSQDTREEIRAEDITTHVKYLASDEMDGRKSGTEGNQKAASYIADLFERYGLQPAGDNGTFFQSFDFTSAVQLGKSNFLTFSGPNLPPDGIRLVADVDFRPLGFSMNDKVEGTLVFAGYGISAPDQGYDDYSALDVEGRIVVVLRYTPAGNDAHSELSRHGAFRNKARMARERGAKAVLVVTGPNDDPADELAKLSFDQSTATSGIPIQSVKCSVLDELLKSRGLNCQKLQDSIKQTGKPVSLDLQDIETSLQVDVNLIQAKTANIIGYLPGVNRKGEAPVLVIGAHMDHLGWGGAGTGSLEPDTHAIHNGADDNASGTAGLLELAEAFASHSDEDRMGLLFIAFSGEEIGTLGSGHYVENPIVPLDKTAAMINMDMIGRLRDGSLTVYGTGTSPAWKPLLEKMNRDSAFSLSMVDDGYGPSDHAQFYGKDIPVLFFFTGSHNEYHKPADDWQTLNYDGAERVVRYISMVADEIASGDRKPEFAKVESSSPPPGGGSEGRQFSVTLGVIPDYAAEGEGMKIGGVRPNGPAEKAGLQPGDIIVGMKGKKVLNIYDYMGILGDLKSGELVEVDILRGSERKTFIATMQARN